MTPYQMLSPSTVEYQYLVCKYGKSFFCNRRCSKLTMLLSSQFLQSIVDTLGEQYRTESNHTIVRMINGWKGSYTSRGKVYMDLLCCSWYLARNGQI